MIIWRVCGEEKIGTDAGRKDTVILRSAKTQSVVFSFEE